MCVFFFLFKLSDLAPRSHQGGFYWLENAPEPGGVPSNLLAPTPHRALTRDAQQIQTSVAQSQCLPPSQPIYNALLYGWFDSQTLTWHVDINVSLSYTQLHPSPPTIVRKSQSQASHQNAPLSCINPASTRLLCGASLIPPLTPI